MTSWVLVCYSVLLTVSLVGELTLIKIVFLFLFFFTLARDQLFGMRGRSLHFVAERFCTERLERFGTRHGAGRSLHGAVRTLGEDRQQKHASAHVMSCYPLTHIP